MNMTGEFYWSREEIGPTNRSQPLNMPTHFCFGIFKLAKPGIVTDYKYVFIDKVLFTHFKPFVQVTTQAPTTTQEPESIFEEEGSGGFGGNSFEGMDMSQFDTYDYGYEDDDRSEEIQDSF